MAIIMHLCSPAVAAQVAWPPHGFGRIDGAWQDEPAGVDHGAQVTLVALLLENQAELAIDVVVAAGEHLGHPLLLQVEPAPVVGVDRVEDDGTALHAVRQHPVEDCPHGILANEKCWRSVCTCVCVRVY